MVGSPGETPNEAAIAESIPLVCERVAAILEASDGIDAFMRRDVNDRAELRRKQFGEEHQGILDELLFLFLRPYMWFEVHFAKYLGVHVAELRTIAPHVYRGDLTGARAYVIRYEDIDASAQLVLEDVGITDAFHLAREHVSDEKKFSTAVRDGVAAAPLDRLRALSNASSYARQFGYAA
jgi:hypothetical protein